MVISIHHNTVATLHDLEYSTLTCRLFFNLIAFCCRVEELRSAIGSLVTISRVLRHRRAMEGTLDSTHTHIMCVIIFQVLWSWNQ